MQIAIFVFSIEHHIMKFILLSVVLFLGIIIHVAAQEAGFKPLKDVDVFSNKFDVASKKLTSIHSDFVQEKHLSMMEADIKSNGKFKYKKENKVRLEYTAPFQYLMVLNNGKMYIKDGSKINKFDTNANKTFREINDMMVATLKGDVLHSRKYNVTYFENESSYLLEMKPTEKAIQEMMQKIKIYIDKKTLHVHTILMMEASGDYTKMIFKNSIQNAAINDTEFVVK